MARTAQIRKEKRQSIITIRHEGQSIRKFQELWKFLQVQSIKPSNTAMKLSLMRTATGMEDQELPLLQRINSLVNCISDCSLNKCFRVQVIDTSQHHLFRGGCESGLHGRNHYQKDTNNKKRLTWSKKHEQWTLDRWKSVLWSDESKFEIFGSNRCHCDGE